ncbi:unnamed protein product [Closterium sp. NIES-53]
MTDAEVAGGEEEGEGGGTAASGVDTSAAAAAAGGGSAGDVRGKLKAAFPADVGPAKKPTSGLTLSIAPPPSSSSSMAIVPVPSAEEKKGSGSGSGFPFRFGFGFGSSSSAKAASAAAASAGAGAGARAGGSQGIQGGPVGLTGLVNLGNTCFMNSALQCLVHTVPLVEYFMADYMREINRSNPLGMEVSGDSIINRKFKGLVHTVPLLEYFMADYLREINRSNPLGMEVSSLPVLDSQGLHEDLNRVMRKPYIEAKDADGRADEDVARENWENHKARNDSIIVDKFQGQYKSTLVCPHCKKVSVTFDPFMYLSLPLPSKATRSLHLTLLSSFGDQPPRALTVTVPRTGRILDLQRALAEACQLPPGERLHVAECCLPFFYYIFVLLSGVTLFSCLDAFIKEEPLGPDDMWYCPQCKEHRQATKKLDLWRLPEILVVHLKRFSYSRYFKNKLDTLVTFPIHDFDLSPYLPPCNAEGGSNVYELYAISNHYGGMGGGHYTAYVQLGNERQWHTFDDSFVSPAIESQIETPAAYVLFYRRVGSSHHYAASQNEATGDGQNNSTADATDMDRD